MIFKKITKIRSLHTSIYLPIQSDYSLCRHEMETFYALLAPLRVPGGFPSERPVTQNFDVVFDVDLDKRLDKQYKCRSSNF